MGDLERDTAVEGGDGHYGCRLSEDWEIWGPNGGYVASVALRAAGAHSRFDRPASIVGHFLGVAEFDPVDIEVTTLRAAKRAESIRVSMTQGGPADLRSAGVGGRRRRRLRARRQRDARGARPGDAAVAARSGSKSCRWSRTSGSGPTSTSGSPTGSTIRSVGEPARDRSGVGSLVPLRPAQHLRRSVGRRVPVADPARHAGSGRPRATTTRAAVHRAEHRHLRRLPPLPAARSRGCTASHARRARPTGSSAARATCGRTTARCSRSARASCSAGPPAQ